MRVVVITNISGLDIIGELETELQGGFTLSKPFIVMEDGRLRPFTVLNWDGRLFTFSLNAVTNCVPAFDDIVKVYSNARKQLEAEIQKRKSGLVTPAQSIIKPQGVIPKNPKNQNLNKRRN